MTTFGIHFPVCPHCKTPIVFIGADKEAGIEVYSCQCGACYQEKPYIDDDGTPLSPSI